MLAGGKACTDLTRKSISSRLLRTNHLDADMGSFTAVTLIAARRPPSKRCGVVSPPPQRSEFFPCFSPVDTVALMMNGLVYYPARHEPEDLIPAASLCWPTCYPNWSTEEFCKVPELRRKYICREFSNHGLLLSRFFYSTSDHSSDLSNSLYSLQHASPGSPPSTLCAKKSLHRTASTIGSMLPLQYGSVRTGPIAFPCQRPAMISGN